MDANSNALLTLHSIGHILDGGGAEIGKGEPFLYEVRGLSHGRSALIARTRNDSRTWQLLQIRDEVTAGWDGAYATAAAAFADVR